MEAKRPINVTINNVLDTDEAIKQARLLLLENKPIPNRYELYQDNEKMPEIIKLRILEYFYEAYDLYGEWACILDDLCDMSYYNGDYHNTFIWEIMQHFHCIHIQDEIDSIKGAWEFDGVDEAISRCNNKFALLKSDENKIEALNLDSYFAHHNSNGFIKDAVRQIVWVDGLVDNIDDEIPELPEVKKRIKAILNDIPDPDNEQCKEMIFDTYAYAFAAMMKHNDKKRVVGGY